MKIVLVRHGQSEWNKKNIFTGWSDVELSPKGQEEAIQSGIKLQEAGLHFDKVYTSFLKRAIHTSDLILSEMDAVYLPITKAWELNERHYGALQGLNKAQVALEYGDDQVKQWRRSYKTMPPLVEPGSAHDPSSSIMYRNINSDKLPLGESLEMTVQRVIPYFNKTIRKDMLNGERVLIVAHGNSLRALLKELVPYSDDEIIGVEIPTGVPLLLEFDEDFTLLRSTYL